jgi:hypothetical protein
MPWAGSPECLIVTVVPPFFGLNRISRRESGSVSVYSLVRQACTMRAPGSSSRLRPLM